MGGGCEGNGDGGGGNGRGGTGGEKQPVEDPHERQPGIAHVYRPHHEEHEGGGGGGDDAVPLTTDPSGSVAPSSGVVHEYWATVAVVSSDASSGTRTATIHGGGHKPRGAERINQQQLRGPPPKPRTDQSTQTRSLCSRSRVDWAVEAARRVRGGLVAAHF